MSAAVVIGGEGIVGTWLKGLLQDAGWSVVSVDINDADVVADARCADPRLQQLVSTADLVALALPEDVTLQVAESIEPMLGANAVFVSTASVQSPLFESPAGVRRRRQLVGCNPMFRPTLDTEGRSVLVVVTADADEEAVTALGDALEGVGAIVERLSPAEHDAVVALTQVLPHAALIAVASVLADSSVDPGLLWRLAPPPARVMFAGAARILDSSAHVYADIQRAAGAEDIRTRLAENVSALGAGGTEDLADRLGILRSSLATVVGPAAALAADLYELTGTARSAAVSGKGTGA